MVFFAPVIVKYMKKNLDLTKEFGRSPATSLNRGSTVQYNRGISREQNPGGGRPLLRSESAF